MIGQVIGNYRLVAEIGRGGMGMVYRAEHVQLGKPAAVKMLLPKLSSDPGIVQRFFNEARAASAIDHPGIVEVHDFGTHTDGAAYIVMALLRGESLEARLRRGPLAPLEGASIVAQVTSALAAAHARGIVHRDLKPDNIFLVPNELVATGVQVKLLDFGIAKLTDEQNAGFKTQTGSLMGTPAYMSPEQCMGRSDIDHRTDLYAVGCILFHVLTGRPPFVTDQGTGMLIAAHLRDPAPDPRGFNPHVPESLADITRRLLEKDPAARFQTAADLRAALVAAGASAPATLPPAPSAPAMPSSGGPYTGPEAYGVTTAPVTGAGASAPGPASGYEATVAGGALGTPTTRSGSAAQLLVAPTTGPGKSRTVVWIAVAGLLAAIAGVGVFAATRGGDDAPAAPRAATGPSALPAPAPPAPPAPTPPTSDPVPSAATTPAATPAAVAAIPTPCPDGQVRGDDTRGECCWPDQAWSSAKHRCVGRPRCPAGMIARGEQCAAEREKKVAIEPAATAAGATTFTLDAKRYRPGAKVQVRFPSAVRSPAGRRAWITIVEASAPPSQYGTWEYVDDGARTTSLVAPSKDGDYEVRLHTDYPVKPTNLVHAVRVRVGDVTAEAEAPVPSPVGETPRAQQRFSIATRALRRGDPVHVRFPAPLRAAEGERFWVTLVERGAADDSWGPYEYVPPDARTLTLRVSKPPGDYEVRLHANYPAKKTNVVHRVAVTIE